MKDSKKTNEKLKGSLLKKLKQWYKKHLNQIFKWIKAIILGTLIAPFIVLVQFFILIYASNGMGKKLSLISPMIKLICGIFYWFLPITIIFSLIYMLLKNDNYKALIVSLWIIVLMNTFLTINEIVNKNLSNVYLFVNIICDTIISIFIAWQLLSLNKKDFHFLLSKETTKTYKYSSAPKGLKEKVIVEKENEFWQVLGLIISIVVVPILIAFISKH